MAHTDASSTNIPRTSEVTQSTADATWTVSDISLARGQTLTNESGVDTARDIIPPPTPFRLLVTPSETEHEPKPHPETCERKISTDLKKEIELSLLHWPSNVESTELAYRSLNRPARSSKTLPNGGESSQAANR